MSHINLNRLHDIESIRGLVAGCVAGNKNVQKQLFKMYYGKCMVIAMRYAENENLAKNFLKYAFIEIFEKINTFDTNENIEAWIKSILVNTSLEFIRRDGRLTADIDELTKEMLVADFDFNEVDGFSDLSPEKIINEIQSLSPACRIVFNMFVFEDMSHEEISKKLNISSDLSKSILTKSKIILTDSLETFIKQKNELDLASAICE